MFRKDNKICSDCSGELKADSSSNEMICSKCGNVVEKNQFEMGQEWREFNHEQAMNRRRSGNPTSLATSDQGLTTEVGNSSDMYNLNRSQKKEVLVMKKWQRRISTPIERNIKFALAELRRIGANLDLPRVINEEAARIYRTAAERGLVRGRSMESVVAGAAYIACKKYNVPRTLKEISEIFQLDIKDVGKTYRFICRQLAIKILPPNPKDYVHRFASDLKLPAPVQTRALTIIDGAQEKEIISGKGPIGIAAASLYIASLILNEKRTQREVAEVAGVTEVTIRNRYKELIKKLGLEEQVEKIRDDVDKVPENSSKMVQE